MPAPGGAIAVLLPIYLFFLGMPKFVGLQPIVFLYTLAIAILMVSRLPVFSGKRVGKRVAPEMVLPVFVVVVAFFALLIAYPWLVLAIGTLAYLASLPFGVLAYRKHEAADAEAKSAPAVATASPAVAAETQPTPAAASPDDERPARLN
jgi:CDP-diacylglycerol--serine O-phosphatidyltransferase